MKVYIFISEKNHDTRAFTHDETGSNLPADYGPWRTTNGGRAIHIGSTTDPIALTIREDGYCLFSATREEL
jgi:hypothetical protein